MVDIPVKAGVSTNIDVKQVKGLVPALDARQLSDPFVMNGANFLPDTKGIKASFANKILTYSPLINPATSTTVRVGATTYVCTDGCILAYDYITEQFYPVYTFVDDGSQWPWSVAPCGNNYFFCRKGVGVISFDTDTNQFMLLDPTTIPSDPRAVAASYGHLIICGQYRTSWSAQDDGTDNDTTSLDTGAGSQGHTIIAGDAQGICVKQTNSGFLVYTDKGVYEGQLSFSGAPFRFIPYNRAYAPVNPFCFADIDDTTHVVLDRTGLYQVVVDGLSPYQDANNGFAEFDPIFNRWLLEDLLPTKDLTIQTTFRMFYDYVNKYLYLSIANDSNPLLYTVAYVNHTPRKEWGIFNYNHFFIGEVHISSGFNQGINLGFCDSLGYFRYFTSDIFSEVWPSGTEFYQWVPAFEFPFRNQTVQNVTDGNVSVNIFASEIYFRDFDEAIFFDLPAGLYSLTFGELIEPPLLGAPVPEVAVLVSVTVEDWNISTDPPEDWDN